MRHVAQFSQASAKHGSSAADAKTKFKTTMPCGEVATDLLGLTLNIYGARTLKSIRLTAEVKFGIETCVASQ